MRSSRKSQGELVPGKWADLVVLDRDITQISPEAILGTKVLRTVVTGKTVYEAHWHTVVGTNGLGAILCSISDHILI
jgi:dihydroorotase-like cyclic amidohydrolase